MRYFTAVMGALIILTFLAAIFTGAARADESGPASSPDAGSMDYAPLIYLGLVGGVALLAVFMWLRMMYRIPTGE